MLEHNFSPRVIYDCITSNKTQIFTDNQKTTICFPYVLLFKIYFVNFIFPGDKTNRWIAILYVFSFLLLCTLKLKITTQQIADLISFQNNSTQLIVGVNFHFSLFDMWARESQPPRIIQHHNKTMYMRNSQNYPTFQVTFNAQRQLPTKLADTLGPKLLSCLFF